MSFEQFILEGKRPRIRTIIKINPEEVSTEDAEPVTEYDGWQIVYTNNKAEHDIKSYILDPARAGLANIKEFNTLLKKTLKQFELAIPEGYEGPYPDDDAEYVLVFKGFYNFKMPLALLSIEDKKIRIRTILHKDFGIKDSDIQLYSEMVDTIELPEIKAKKPKKTIFLDVIVTK